MTTSEETQARDERALKLLEAGIRQCQIAERFGTSAGHVGAMIKRARARRAECKSAGDTTS